MLKPSSDTSSTPSATGKQEEKTDIKKLLAVIPPPAVVFAKEKKSLKEKRIRLQYDPSVGKDEAKISKTLASELNIKNYLEVTVAGKKRFRFKAVVLEGPPNDVVYVNPEVMKLQGVADRSICTIRSAD
uniref:Uncharacterized protein n=1 Tax=Ignisphaera aggregans TaxID=334771 RepID=A0A7C2VGX9_9CREN